MERRIARWWPLRRQARPTWSIRAKILTLLLLPVVPLLSMWMFTTGATLEPALNLFASVTNLRSAGVPSAALVAQLQTERRLSMSWTGGRHDAATKAALANQRAKTDAAVATLDRETAASAFRGAETGLTRQYLAVLHGTLGRLAAERASVDRSATVDRTAAARAASGDDLMTYFDGVIDDAFGLYGSISAIDDRDLARQAQTVVGLMQAHEMLAREDAIVAGAAASDSLDATSSAMLVGAIGAERYLYQQATRFLPAADQQTYQATLSGPAFTRLRGAEDRLSQRAPTKTGLPIGFDASAWRADFDSVNARLTALESTEARRTLAATTPVADRTVTRLAVAGGIGLIVLVVLIVVSVRIARSIIGRVHGLRTEALTLARERLPGVVARLRSGEPVDVVAESPPLAYGTDELGQLGDAFSRVQRTAIASAVHEAELRAGLNEVFLNIARRSQALLHRQLALLDDMERRVTEPDDLAALFRIDHLATRMRRHAEDLVILAGATPGRGWRFPVAFTDVLRAAAAEVELYPRISVRALPDLALAGHAVGDTVHLIAELLENATSFSPPDTQVTVSVQVVPNGCAIEIEDRGIGIQTEALAAANARLAAAPDFHPSQSTRLGLFVVARLAARHGIRVTLRESPFGGVTAVVLLPPEIVVAEPEPPELTPRPTPRGAMRVLASVPDVIDGTADEVDALTRVTDGSGAFDTTLAEPSPPADDGTDEQSPAESNSPDDAPALPRQRTLTLVPPDAAESTVSGVTADGLPQRVRPSGRHGRAVRLASTAVPTRADDVAGEDVVERTDGDPTPPGTPRTPERMRTMLTSFQDGMALGRNRAQATLASVPENDAESTDAEPIDSVAPTDTVPTDAVPTDAAPTEDVAHTVDAVTADGDPDGRGGDTDGETDPGHDRGGADR